MTNKLFAFLFLLLAAASLNAQSLERSVVSTAGNDASASGISLDFTVGETTIGEFTAGGISISQGFNQSVKKKSGNTPEVSLAKLSIYPNPSDKQFSLESDRNLNFTVYDHHGSAIQKGELLGSKVHILEAQLWSQGIYQLVLTDDSGLRLTKRLIRH